MILLSASSSSLRIYPKHQQVNISLGNYCVLELPLLQIMEKRGAQKAMPILFISMVSFSKELNESFVWLRIIERSGLLRQELMTELLDENQQLCRIFTSSLKTARFNRQ